MNKIDWEKDLFWCWIALALAIGYAVGGFTILIAWIGSL